jgi:hypothetical protein
VFAEVKHQPESPIAEVMLSLPLKKPESTPLAAKAVGAMTISRENTANAWNLICFLFLTGGRLISSRSHKWGGA